MELFLKNSSNISNLEEKEIDFKSVQKLMEKNLKKFFDKDVCLVNSYEEENKTLLFDKKNKSFLCLIYDNKISIEIGQTNIDKINSEKEKILKIYNEKFKDILEDSEIKWKQTKLIFLNNAIKHKYRKTDFNNKLIEIWEVNTFQDKKEIYFSIEKIITSKSIKKHEKIKYNIPQLGKIEAVIYGNYAKKCYEYLKKEKYIDKLKEIDQLGIIRKSLEGVHHTRWEYVVLQIYLINKLKDKKMGLGINSNLKLNINGKKIEISCVEIIQIWVLLLNSGHLHGTFASEKGILEYLKQNKKLKRKILNYFKNKDIKKIYSNIIEKEMVYETHKFLIYFNLEKEYSSKYHPKYENDRELILILLEFLKYYMEKEPFNNEKDKKIKKLKFIFKKIRKIAYLFLDTHYSTFPMVFDISKFIINIEEYIDELFQEGSQLNNTLDDFSNLLESNLYQTENSMKEFTIQKDGVKNNIEKNEVSNITDFYKFLKKKDNFNLEEKNEYTKTLNLKFELRNYRPYDFILEKVKKNIYDSFKSMENISDIKMSLEESIHSMSINLNLIFNEKNKIKVLSHLTNKMINLDINLNNITNYNAANNFEKFRIEYYLERFNSETMGFPGSKLILRLLSEFTRNKIHYEWDSFSDMKSKIIYFKGKHDFNEKMENIELKTFKNKIKISKSDKNTLNCIKILMNEKNSGKKGIVGLTPIMLYSKNNNDSITDIDAFILFSTKEKIELILLEAKKQNKNAEQAAKKQLNESIQQMNFIKPNERIHTIKNAGGKVIGCYCKIKFI